MKKIVLLPFAGLLIGVAGCGDSGPERFDLQGEVTYKGKPLPAGVVIFDPDATRGVDGPQGYALVKDGKFDTRDQGRPVSKGPHLVRVQGFDGKPGNELPMGKTLFREHVTPMELDEQQPQVSIEVNAKTMK